MTDHYRQIRNAFQTAIALTEYEALMKKPDDPKPILGKRQFKTVADGFKEFEDYLITTLGETESQIAKREGAREDRFPIGQDNHKETPSFLSTTPSNATAHATTFKKSFNRAGSTFESDESTDSESEDESEGEQRDASHTGKSVATSSIKEPSAHQADNIKQFQEFLEWKKTQLVS